MIDRRTFSAALAGTVAMPGTLWGQKAKANAVFYANIGPELTLYDIDADAGTLARRSTVTLPANVQYVWPHPSRSHLYVVSSDAPSGNAPTRGTTHRANALRIDPASGALSAHGEAQVLPSRPIHASVDRKGEYLLTAYNNPSNVTVHRIKSDGTLGEMVAQPDKPDAGIFAHQILTMPDNRSAILVARGNNPEGGKPEDPGALKLYGFKDGVLSNRASVQPGNGLGFGPRHLDFHPTLPLVFVSIERQNQLSVYRLESDGSLGKDPLFVKTSLAEPDKARRGQMAGAIHVHPNGRFVYLTNRNSAVEGVDGRRVFAGGENNVAVFSIDQGTGEPTLIQTIEARTNHLRTFSIDPSGTMLIAASILPILVREEAGVATLPAAMVVYRIGSDGKLEFVRKYDVDTAKGPQWWSAIVTLPA